MSRTQTLGVLVGLVAVTATIVLALDRTGEPLSTDGSALVIPDGADVYDPVAAGEDLPQGYRLGFARDQIAPVYQPEFTTGDQVDWPGDSLVIGVAGTTTAKAYPVTHLNQREMVIDSLEGIPILVTW